ncbi:unnamed protein product [Paramecium sonneborni]|uniref:WD40-repeat-containing domain n=1 Tax=Paramecium sonneborni TaxID=65129 RepID=A0A8S1NFB0_9CILI|nr:unnamed protein product [Paramecium sonneborni]
MYQQNQQKVQMKEDITKIICANDHKDRPIEFIRIDDGLRAHERLLCQKCIEFFNNPPNLLYIDNALDQVQQLKQQCFDGTQNAAREFTHQIKNFIEKLDNFRNEVQNLTIKLIEACKNWILYLDTYVNLQSKYNFLDEIEHLSFPENEIKEQRLAFDIYEIHSINENNIYKVYAGIKNVGEKLKAFSVFQGMANQIVKNAYNYEHFQNNKLKNTTCQLNSEYKEEELCNALALNGDDTIIATAASKDIKIWKFLEGQLYETNIILQGHNDQVVCLNFSQKENYLISGSKDETVKFWQEISQNKWQFAQQYKINSSYLLCQVMNQIEDQLIVGCFDGSIKIINFKIEQNKILDSYRLDQHKKPVYCISLNSKENQFVSSSGERQIILWEKNETQIWEFKYIIDKQINDVGYRISYFGDDTIVFQQKRNSQTHFFKLQNFKFQERPDLRLVLNNEEPEVECFFPIIYNKKNQILVLKHSQYVYLIKQNKLQYQIDCEPIDCQHPWNYGTMTKDGKFLIIWEYATKKFKVHLIDY